MAIKILRVCLSSELPSVTDRQPNYMYLTYDKLFLYAGQDRLNVNFAIANALPEVNYQVEGMFYILTTDGSVHRKVDYVDSLVATIENQSMIEILRKAGTMFYIDSDHRYIDSQQRSLTLPYNNGIYELNAAVRNDAIFDNDTILKYNEDTGRFEVYSGSTEEFIDFSKPFVGKETSTVKMIVDGPRIEGRVKVSSAEGNLIKTLSDGLYVKSYNFVSRDDFDYWADVVSNQLRNATDILVSLQEAIADVQELITPEYIHSEILAILTPEFPTIQEAINNYALYVQRLNDLESYIVNYAIQRTAETRETLIEMMEENSDWNNLDDTYIDFEEEVDYYSIAEDVLNPQSNLMSALLNAAVSAYLAAEEEEGHA